MMKKFLPILLLIISIQVDATPDSLQSINIMIRSDCLLYENMLHPGDGFTGLTLSRGEWVYNHPIGYMPGWLWWGITDRITAEIDAECWLGGVPSFNFRYRILKKPKQQLAFETMYQYLPNEIDQLKNYDYLNTKRQGNSWYGNLNFTSKIVPGLNMNISAGITFTEYVKYENNNRDVHLWQEYHDLVSPNFSLYLQTRMREKTSWFLGGSYGTTFVYMDNLPLKQQFTGGLRWAPFLYWDKNFFNTLRAEILVIYYSFKDAGEYVASPFGYIYWQW